MRQKMLAGAAALFTILAAQGVAHAGVFDFDYAGVLFGTSTAVDVVGTLTTAGTSSTITGITGTDNGAAITGLTTFQGSDNLLTYPANPSYFDFSGLGFTTANLSANIYYNVLGNVYEDSNGATVTGGSLTVTPVPEPGSLLVLGTGLLGLALVMRKRRVG
ncbi:MAG: PEP-CTERM sorting domain-containing protein [Acidiphilium sp.]|nr:PEP-CTERM sorting domain-containing protein [Acidiphilium sp.]